MKTVSKIALLTASLAASSATWAAGTAAGSVISNTATAVFDDPATGNSGTISATAPDITVAELINVNVVTENKSPVEGQPGETGQVLEFTVTNVGNGNEAFTLDATNLIDDDIDIANVVLYQDDGDGVFNPTNDAPVSTDINLDADESTTIFVVGDIPADATTGQQANVRLTAASATPGVDGAAPGTLIPNQGTNTTAGAVVGESSTDSDSATIQVGEIITDATVAITKTIESRIDPFGGTTDVPGTVVTYLITVTPENGPVDNLVVTDSIPLEMTLVPSSVTIDTVKKTDTVGDDEVDVSDAVVTVTLGTVAQDSTTEIRLDAEIK